MLESKILKRIKALEAMANDASSEYEAMIAARRLHAVLAKHGLNQVPSDVIDVGSDHKEAPLGLWAKMIGASLAELYFCSFHFTTVNNRVQHLNVTGSELRRSVALSMINSALAAVDTAAKLSRPDNVNGWAWATSFRNGAATRIAERCKELVDMAKCGELEDVENEGTMLPALRPMYDRELAISAKYRDEKFKLKRTSRVSVSSSLAARRAGHEFGGKVQLIQHIEAQS